MTEVDTETDPLIAALEAQREKLRQAKPATEYKNLYSARDRYWQPKGRRKPFLFAYTSDRVAREFDGKEQKGYASYVYTLKGDTYELTLDSVKLHKTKREAMARAWDLYCGWRLARGLTMAGGWGRHRR